MLLADAVKRTVSAGEEIAVYAIIVDAKDRDAKRLCQAFGFETLQDQPMRLFLSLSIITV